MQLSPRQRLRLLVVTVALVAGLTGGWMWLRDSSLVRVQDVTVVGVEGRQAAEIRDTLVQEARSMTTLRVREGALLQSVGAYPVVKSLRTERDLPHGLRIVINAYEPVVVLEAGGQRTAVAADGTLLRGASVRDLPRLKVARIDGGSRISDPATMRFVRLLAAAPARLRGRVERAFRGPRGLSTTLRKGPKLYFGGDGRYAAKWAAAAKVLSDSSSLGAAYIDLRLPGRPSAGGLPPLPADPAPEVPELDPTLGSTTATVPTQ